MLDLENLSQIEAHLTLALRLSLFIRPISQLKQDTSKYEAFLSAMPANNPRTSQRSLNVL
jgi:hypothetical protein